MAHFWLEQVADQADQVDDQVEEESQWDHVPLIDGYHGISEAGIHTIETGDPSDFDPGATLIARGHTQTTPEQWVLLSGAESPVFVNGEPPTAGVRVLRDRDALWIGGSSNSRRRLYFSLEELVKIEPYPHDKPAACPRCKQSIEQGMMAVRCVKCAVWHHQGTPECWTYTETCAACFEQPTALDSGYRWTPEEL